MKLRHYEIITSLFLCPLECSVNGVNSLTHITLTRVTEFFSDVKSGFDSKIKTETNSKDQNPINATQNEWPKGSKPSYQRYYLLSKILPTFCSFHYRLNKYRILCKSLGDERDTLWDR